MINIIQEPKGRTYQALLMYAVKHCRTFSLVWRYKLRPETEKQEIVQALAPFLLSEQESSKWPGTKLLNSRAIVQHYKFSHEVLPVLNEMEGLYSWLHPQYPEDLTLYLPNGDAWLASIAHEHEAWISDGKLGINELVREIPELQVIKV